MQMNKMVIFSTRFYILESLYHKARTKDDKENNVFLWSQKWGKFSHYWRIFDVHGVTIFVEIGLFSTEDDPLAPQNYTYTYSMDTGVYNIFNLGPLTHFYMLISSWIFMSMHNM